MSPTLSVLDLVPVRSDQTSADAVAATLALARTADELGYHRYWLAEHHNMPAVARGHPTGPQSEPRGDAQAARRARHVWIGSSTHLGLD